MQPSRAASPVTVDLDSFRVHGCIGEGSFGKVLMVSHKGSGDIYAMKVLRKDDLVLRGQHSVSQAITEKQVLQEMAAKPHPYIVSLNFAFQDMVRLAGRSAARPAAQSPAARPLGPEGPVTA